MLLHTHRMLAQVLDTTGQVSCLPQLYGDVLLRVQELGLVGLVGGEGVEDWVVGRSILPVPWDRVRISIA